MQNWYTEIKSRAIRRLSLGYVVGSEVRSAVRACRIAAHNGWSATVGPWHAESNSSRDVLDLYLGALDAIHAENLDAYLSIKVWALNYDDGMLGEVLDRAASHRIRIHFDSLDEPSASRCLALLEKAQKTYNNLGYTLPGRWRRSLPDAERLAELALPVRIVKGEHADPGMPGKDLRDGFLEIVDFLAGKARHVDVATHDTRLVGRVLQRLISRGTPCHLEQLYGLPLHSIKLAERQGVPVRIYIPYGAAYLGYGLSKIRQRPIILTWIIKDLIMGDRFRLPQPTELPERHPDEYKKLEI